MVFWLIYLVVVKVFFFSKKKKKKTYILRNHVTFQTSLYLFDLTFPFFASSSSACGGKFPSKCTGQHCPVCKGVRENIYDEILGDPPQLRDSEEVFAAICEAESSSNILYKEALLSKYGFTRLSSTFPTFLSTIPLPFYPTKKAYLFLTMRPITTFSYS